MKKILLSTKFFVLFLLLLSAKGWGQYYDMSSGDYSQTFTSWTSPATGNWTSVAVSGTTTIPSATKITVASSSFQTSSQGVFNGNTNIQFLTTGTSDNTNSVALDLNLNFSNRTAGNLSFDVATVFNSTGDRKSSFRVYYTVNGTDWSELTGVNLPYTATNNVAGSASVNISLPTTLSNQSSVKFRFYQHNGSGGTTGSRPKISLDNVSVTSTAVSTSPTITVSSTSVTGFSYTQGSGPSPEKNFIVSGSNLTDNISVIPPANYEISTATGSSFSSTNPIVLTQTGGVVGNTTIYARLKAGLNTGTYNNENVTLTSSGAADKTVTFSGEVLTNSPTIQSSVTALSGFTYTGTGPSSSQNFTVTGSNLTNTVELASANNKYEFSTTSNGTYTSTLSLSPTSGSVNQVVYVRMKTGLSNGVHNDVINITNADVTTSLQVNLSGTVCGTVTLPYYENFDYTATTKLSDLCWGVQGIATPNVTVSTGSLSYSGYGSSGVGNSVTLGSGEDVNKAFTPQTTGSVYASILVNVTAATTTGDYFFHFGDSPLTANFRGRVFVKKDASGNLAFGISNASGTVSYSAFSYTINTTYLLILKYEIISGAGNDITKLYINPLLNAPEHASTTINGTDAMTDLASVASIALRQGGSTTAPTVQVDGLRVSTNWEDIVGVIPTTIWTGSPAAWTNNAPNANTNATIDAVYTGDGFAANNLIINSDLTINNNQTVTAKGTVTNNGTITVNDGGNFIQGVGSAYTGTGTFSLNKNTTSAAGKYVFWSSPVVGQNMFNIYGAAGTPQYVMTYDSNNDIYAVQTSATAGAGIGYSVKVPATAASASFTGTPHNGDVPVTLDAVATDNANGNTWNLIGNPYPSNLNLVSLYNGGSNGIESSIYLWDNISATNTSQQQAATTWAIFNASGTGTWSQAGSLTVSGVSVKPGQGFIVKGKAGSATFTNAMRNADAATFANKSAQNSSEGKYWLTLTTPSGSSFSTAVTYGEGAQNTYEAFDSAMMGVGSEGIYSYLAPNKLAIQGRADFVVTDVVALGNKQSGTGNYTISLADKTGLFTGGQPIYLRDKLLGTYTDLQAGSYSFAATALEQQDRFEVVYQTQGALGTSENVKAEVQVYKEGDHFTVTAPEKIKSITVYDASGRVITVLKPNRNTAQVSLSAKGVYMLNIEYGNQKMVKKVMK